jgi:hypothetical protein
LSATTECSIVGRARNTILKSLHRTSERMAFAAAVHAFALRTDVSIGKVMPRTAAYWCWRSACLRSAPTA